jgi:hypothetical protein
VHVVAKVVGVKVWQACFSSSLQPFHTGLSGEAFLTDQTYSGPKDLRGEAVLRQQILAVAALCNRGKGPPLQKRAEKRSCF